MKNLDFHNEILCNLVQEDGLAIMAKGLGVEHILLNLVKLFCDPINLVLVIGATSKEEEFIRSCLVDQQSKHLPKIVTAESSSNIRRGMYMEGGVLFVTSRILVVDLLTEKVPIDLITGIIVYRAHQIVESCQEAFILRLYKQKNKTGFVKALSQSPFSFTTGFCQVSRVMKNLFVGALHLWPRFHGTVQATLDKYKPEVIELQLRMTSAMQAIQMAVLDLMSICVKEIRRINPSVDTEELTVENAICRALDKIIKLQLEPVWHQLGPKTKNLVYSLKTLRHILISLTQYDCVSFYNEINSIRASEKSLAENSNWLLLDSADEMFIHAKGRVFGSQSKKAKLPKGAAKEATIEVNPKWLALSEVLDEIKQQTADLEMQTHTLVLAEDERTCSQLQQYLTEGSQHVLQKILKATSFFSDRSKSDQGKKASGKSTNATSSDDKLANDTSSQNGDVINEAFTIFHAIRFSNDSFFVQKFLEEFHPPYIVMYDADMNIVRQLEIYKACNPNIPLRVYFLVYEESAEEQRYLTTLRKEKQAFEFLIKEKVTMVVPSDIEGRCDDNPDLLRDQTPASQVVNTRRGGMPSSSVPSQQKVIVDMREFRSELPSLIHRRGIDIEPITLEVGDYILTPDICVERKSVSDLISSLNSGRLYNQAQAMSRYYKRPMLLIEFDHNKSFSLQGKFYLSNESMSMTDVSSKLVLLTLHFPKLRIMWCPNPYATAELFEELKEGRPQPDTAKALTISDESSTEISAETYNFASQNFVSRLPGINHKNLKILLKKGKSLPELSSMTKSELNEIFENEKQSSALFGGFHQKLSTDETSVASKNKTKRKYR